MMIFSSYAFFIGEDFLVGFLDGFLVGFFVGFLVGFLEGFLEGFFEIVCFGFFEGDLV
jgi:hypothetical protein